MADIREVLTQLQHHQKKYEASLHGVQEAMQECSRMAENFTNAVKGLAFGEHGVNGVLGDAHPKRRSKKDHDTDEVPETGKRKRVTKVKDPNAPKRPASSYILFQNSIRADLKKEHPNIQNAELLGLIAKQWQEMPEEDKNVYTKQMESAKERYEADKAAYDARSPEEVATANAATQAAADLKKATPRTRKPKEPKVAAPAKSAKSPPIVEESDTDEASSTVPSKNVKPVDEDADSDSDDGHPARAPLPKKKAAPAPTSEVSGTESEEDEASDDSDEEEAPPPPKKSKASAKAAPVVKEKKKKSHA